jgi:RNA polymerase sigma factor (sigma-70 family)
MLVAAHVDWVYSMARRQLGSSSLADDAVQAVFISLWRRRKGRNNQSRPVGGLLVRATRYACNDIRKSEQRRKLRERKAAAMRHEKAGGLDGNLEVQERSTLLGALDAAMQRLPNRDRDILVARYFQSQSARQVAEQFEISEAAAEKRIARAVLKLRGIMARKNVAMDSAALAALLSNNVDPAPKELLAKVSQSFGGKTPVSPAASHAARSIVRHTAYIPMIAGTAAVLGVGAMAVAPLVLHNQWSDAHGTPNSPPVPIGYSTTRLVAPLDKDGLVNYVEAFNHRFGRGVTPQNNAAAPILLLFRPMYFHRGASKTGATKPAIMSGEAARQRLFTAMGISLKDSEEPHFVGFRDFRKQADAAVIGSAPPALIPLQCYTQPWSAHANPWVGAWLRANEGALDVAMAATRRARFFVPLVASSPHTTMAEAVSDMAAATGINNPWGFFKSILSALTLRAMLELHRRNVTACESYLLAAHRLALLISQEHLLLASMVSSSAAAAADAADISLASSGVLSARQDIVYIARLAAQPKPVPISSVINTSERWMLLSAFEAGASTNNPAGLPIAAWETWWSRAPYRRAMVEVNTFYDHLVKILKAHSSWIVITGLRGFMSRQEAEHANAVKVYMTAMLQSDVAPIYDQTHQIALSRMDRISFALAAYLKSHGTFPAGLSRLAPHYLQKHPDDPFTGRPFRYSIDSRGCALTSPGRVPRRQAFGALRYLVQPLIIRLDRP